MAAAAIRRPARAIQSDNGTKVFQANTPAETNVTPKRKSSAKKDGSRSAVVMTPPALSSTHGSAKRNTVEYRLKLALARMIQTIRNVEIARQANKQRPSKGRADCCFAPIFVVAS